MHTLIKNSETCLRIIAEELHGHWSARFADPSANETYGGADATDAIPAKRVPNLAVTGPNPVPSTCFDGSETLVPSGYRESRGHLASAFLVITPETAIPSDSWKRLSTAISVASATLGFFPGIYLSGQFGLKLSEVSLSQVAWVIRCWVPSGCPTPSGLPENSLPKWRWFSDSESVSVPSERNQPFTAGRNTHLSGQIRDILMKSVNSRF